VCSRDAPLSGRPIIIALAVIAIVLYGFGVPLVHVLLVLRDRDAIVNDRPFVGLSAKISFLHADYSKHVYWWELVESMKKLVLTGFLALIVDPGTLIRLFVAIVIAFVTLVMQGIVSPMKSESDNVMSFLSAVMLKPYWPSSSARTPARRSPRLTIPTMWTTPRGLSSCCSWSRSS
jgi:hypothetical protein